MKWINYTPAIYLPTSKIVGKVSIFGFLADAEGVRNLARRTGSGSVNA